MFVPFSKRTLYIERGTFSCTINRTAPDSMDASTRFTVPLCEDMTLFYPDGRGVRSCVPVYVCVTTQDLHRGQLRCSDRHGGIAEEVLQGRVGGPVRPNAGIQVRRPLCTLCFGGLAFREEKTGSWFVVWFREREARNFFCTSAWFSKGKKASRWRVMYIAFRTARVTWCCGWRRGTRQINFRLCLLMALTTGTCTSTARTTR